MSKLTMMHYFAILSQTWTELIMIYDTAKLRGNLTLWQIQPLICMLILAEPNVENQTRQSQHEQ